MLGKTAPIFASIATARKTGKHVFEGPENENIHVLSGSPEDIIDYVQDAHDAGIRNGFIHAKIAPDHTQNLTPDQWRRVINDWCSEFKLDPKNVCAVLHEKGGHTHLHIIAPGCDPVTGRRTDVSWCYLRTEKLCRKLEADFGHQHVPMKSGHVRSVAARLRAEGRPEVAEAISNRSTAEGAAFSEKQGQRLKRDGYSPTNLKRAVRACWDCSDNAQAMESALAEFGLSVSPGKRKNVWVVSSDDGTELGALDRIVDEKRAVVAARMSSDKSRSNSPPTPISFLEPLPDLPPKLPAAPAILEPLTQPQAPQEPHYEHSNPAPPIAPTPGSSRSDPAGSLTVRVRYRADIGVTRATPDGYSGGSATRSGRGVVKRHPAALRNPDEAQRSLAAIRENRKHTHELSKEDGVSSKRNSRSANKLRIAFFRYRAKARGLAARFGVSVEVVRNAMSKKLEENAKKYSVEYERNILNGPQNTTDYSPSIRG